MKHRKYLLISLICLFAIFSVCFLFRNTKPFVLRYIRRNHIELEIFVENVIENGSYNTTTTYNGWKVSYWSENNMVEFLVRSQGLVPSSTYEGFYYSPEDRPIGFEGTDLEFIKDRNGWRYEESDGDNSEYTERVIGKWYWFKMSF